MTARRMATAMQQSKADVERMGLLAHEVLRLFSSSSFDSYMSASYTLICHLRLHTTTSVRVLSLAARRRTPHARS